MLHQSVSLTGVIASSIIMTETITSRFGDITVDMGKAVAFPRGLLGMPDKSRFVLANFPNPKMQQFTLLQSLDEHALSFITLALDVRNTIIAENDIKAACRDLQIDEGNLALLLIVSVHRGLSEVKLSVNARAPLLIDAHRQNRHAACVSAGSLQSAAYAVSMMLAPDLFALYRKAEYVLAEGDLRQAADLCKQILDADPRFAYGHYLMSQLFKKTGNLDKAVAFAEKAIQCAPDTSLFFVWMAELLFYKKEFSAAEQSARKALAIDPKDVSALGQLFAALMEQHRNNEAGEVMAQIAALTPEDAKLKHLSTCLRGINLENAPREFVAAYFDGYAEQFDRHLQGDLSYRTPSQLAERMRDLPDMKGKSKLSLLDLGCGTGLFAEACKDITGVRVGVDLSTQMLQKARDKELYDELHACDMIEFMQACDRRFDLVVATDVLIYLGNLAPFFDMARKVLSESSLLAFSIEQETRAATFLLNAGHRYSHNIRYVLSLIQSEGYHVLMQEECVLRTENRQPVKGSLFVVKKAHIQ